MCLRKRYPTKSNCASFSLSCAVLLFFALALVLKIAEGQTYRYIAGYEPYSNVTEHAKIDQDLQYIIGQVANYNWANAKTVYDDGQNSVKDASTNPVTYRTIAGFSGASKMANERYFSTANAYWASKGVSTLSNYDYADVIVRAALDQTALGSNSDFTFVGKSNEYLRDVIKKSILYQNIFMYVIWEMQDAINDCQSGTPDNNYNSVHAWDEAVAFYTGYNEGTAEGGDNLLESPSDDNDGCLLFNLAESRCKNFGTCTADYDLNPEAGYSSVNSRMFAKFTTAKNELISAHSADSTFSCSDAYTAKDEIASLMLVPLIQGTLRYLYKTDSAINPDTSGATFKKENGELFAFSAAIQPFVSNCSTLAGKALYDRSFNEDMTHNFASHKASLESVYKCLGITCADVGALCDPGAEGTGCVPYKDSSTSYDTSSCVDTTATATTATKDENEGLNQTAVALITVFVLLFVISLGAAACFWKRSEKYRLEAADHETMGIASNMQIDVDDSHSSHSRVPTSV